MSFKKPSFHINTRILPKILMKAANTVKNNHLNGMKAVILAGGLGTRLQPYTTFLPKAMLPLGDKPLLEHLITWVKKNKITSIVICVSYLRRTIEDYFEDGSKFGVKIQYAVAHRPLATAGQLKTAEEHLHDTFVCIYGDSVFDFDLKGMIEYHKNKKPAVTMAVDRKSTRLNSSHIQKSRMPSSA